MEPDTFFPILCLRLDEDLDSVRHSMAFSVRTDRSFLGLPLDGSMGYDLHAGITELLHSGGDCNFTIVGGRTCGGTG